MLSQTTRYGHPARHPLGAQSTSPSCRPTAPPLEAALLAASPTVPGPHPPGFQSNDSRPIGGTAAGLRLVDGPRGGAGPSAFDLKIWRGKPDCGRHRPLAARGLSAGKPAPGTTASPPLPLARPRPSARELSSSLHGPRRSGRRETAAAAARRSPLRVLAGLAPCPFASR